MAASPVLSGAIPADGLVGLLREIEEHRTTGVIRFDAATVSGELALVCGQIASEQKPRADGRDPVEVMLGLQAGRFQVFQRLPTLPVSSGDDGSRRGSLAVHVPADLMNYCERAGLTGVLSLARGAERAEVVYDRGDLVGIRVDGSETEELHRVFGWEEGTFEIHARAEPVDLDTIEMELPLFPERPPSERPLAGDATGQFLKIVEMALGDIVREREERRPATRTSPPLPPMSTPREDLSSAGRRAERKDPSVKVVYLGARPAAPLEERPSTRHVSGDLTSEVVLADAAPDRLAQEATGERMASDEDEREERAEAGDTADDGEAEAPAEKPEAKEPEPKKASAAKKPEPKKASEAEKPEPKKGAEGNDERRRRHGGGAAVAEQPTLAGTLAWTALVIVFVLSALAILARLPSLE